MIKNLLFSTTAIFFLIGCGGGTESESSTNNINTNNSQSIVSTPKGSYSLWDYIVPSSSKTSEFSVHSQQDGERTYRTSYAVKTNRVEEIADYAENETTIYEVHSDKITIKFLKDGKPNGLYQLHSFANIGEVVTVRGSDCKLAKHHDQYKLDDKVFDDVIEIVCTNQPGLYQKNVGEIAQINSGKDYRVLSN